MNLVSARDVVPYLRGYRSRLTEALNALDADAVAQIVSLLIGAKRKGKTVFVCGNGGSASTSEHWSTDLSHIAEPNGPIKAISLSSNVSKLTSTGNDIGFEMIFSRELSGLASPEDILIVVSASGNSKNLLSAVEVAKELKMTSVGVLGFDGGELYSKVDVPLLVRTEIGDYGVAEDGHLILNHLIREILIDFT